MKATGSGATVEIYRLALDAAGYTHAEATAENVIDCFTDYVAAGYFADLDMYDDLSDIDIYMMCAALICRQKAVKSCQKH